MSVFTGLKVWDASWVGVGPLTARYLADYGATVVHTESSRNPDVLRLAPPFKDGIRGINRSQFFADYNASKLGLGVNLAMSEGKLVAERLAVWADVVIESFSPGVMERLGFGYERLRGLNSDIVMVSTSMNGQTGPRRTFAGFGTVLASMGGFSALTGWPDRPPGSPYGAYTDFIGQRFTATALVAALEHRRRTGEGQYIDLSQMEAGLQFLEPELLDYQLSGRVATRTGNRHPAAAPHGVFPCLPTDGRERWVAIAVMTDRQWTALVERLGRPAWAVDTVLQTLGGRKRSEDVLEERLAEWSRDRTAEEIVGLLQPDIPAGFVHTPADLQTDAQIAHRRYFRTLDHTEMGAMKYEGSQVHLTYARHAPHKAAPLLGEDTRTVLTELLGLAPHQVDQLLEIGAVEEVLDG